ncbi:MULTISPECIES: hypothetical protein [Bradyrhizobium]|uniref:hypothetical protein n=1 Tax=Bradyrhizobium TaxID=374 RepID=UPI000551F6EA|nr:MULTISPECIES: hypothetical protein [unclassified Bradyrhizobium]MDA9426032.1 hypothetical protein [Bradyrhizobium sp. CCBAU 53380]
MATQIVMDSTGDARYQFAPDDARETSEAERRFRQLTSTGFTAAARTATGDLRFVRSFDPTVHETLFFPRLVGG